MSGRAFCDSLIQLPGVRMMGERNRQAYFDQIFSGSEVMDKSLCYCCEWFREQLPTENPSGQSLEVAWHNAVCLGGLGDNPGEYPRDYYGIAPGLRVLVFSDNYGYCSGILDIASNWGRLADSRSVTKAPSAITVEDVVGYLAPGWDLIIFGCGIDTPADNSTKAILDHQNAVTKLYLILLQCIQKNPRATKKLCCITCDIFAEEAEIHEEVGLGLVTCANLFGLTNSARFEVDFPVQFIDTEWAFQDESMPLLASEVFRESTFGKNAVRILNSGRFVLRNMPAEAYEVPENGFELPQKGIIAISGGNGALAMVMGQYLMAKAEELRANGAKRLPEIRFLSRSAKISDENMEGWKAIQEKAQQLGMKAEQHKCDISSPDEVNRFIKECTPNLAGFIHAAGVLQDAMLITQTWEKYETVFNPKSRAALYLHEALEKNSNPGLQFFWLFSSTSVYGNPGATNYSSANSYLDGLARHRRALQKPAFSIQWSSWAEAGMAANMTGPARDRLFNSPQPPFTNIEGIYGLEAGLRTNLPYVSVQKWNATAVMSQTFNGGSPTADYVRNFTAHIAPLPPEALGGKQDIYSLYSSAMGVGDNLVFSNTVEPIKSDELLSFAIRPVQVPRPAAVPSHPTHGTTAAAAAIPEDSGDDTADESEEPTGISLEERIAKRCEIEMAKLPSWVPIGNEDVMANHERRAPGMFYGIEFPWTAAMLEEFGPRWLTRAFHKAGTLPKNNKVTRLTIEKSIKIDAGNNACKFLFQVEYLRQADYLHTQLFAKIPFPLEGMNMTDRLSSSVNKQPMDLYEIDTYRVLESVLPVRTPRFYFGDISNETSNFILITERIPFAEIHGQKEVLQAYEVEGPYEKCKDWQLRSAAKDYYLLTVRKQASIAGTHKAGYFGPEDFLAVHGLLPQRPDRSQPLAWGVRPDASSGVAASIARKRIQAALRFMSQPAKNLFPSYVAEESFQRKFTDTMLKFHAYTSEINYFKEHNVDYVALGHQNLNMDNAYFWRDENGTLDCGLIDWGGFSAAPLPQKLYWQLNCAEFEDVKNHLDEYVAAFIEEYTVHGGPPLDHAQFRTGVFLTGLQNLNFMVDSVPNCLRQCPEKEWSTIEDRHDPRVASNVGGKSTLRTTLTCLHNGVRLIEELGADEVLEQWIQDFFVAALGYEPKSESIIQGE